ncbi:sterol-binding protein [Caldichromatium japonicum]|uniref:Ubiquinone biosynthesis accessory factor UbiJ n=2 Tax=Caldichromatium japonicum TaxID=2699430 RepID=A0A6G7VG57_9GAMM|nr:SCP2 sterol-binding domain-containing protein [Caldichromatium japonicum]QIK39029.1 sterol-binding protein [Caldichromatium japonicum]
MDSGLQIPDGVLAVVEGLVNRALALDPEGAAALDELAGRVIAIEVKGFGTRVTLIPGPARIQLFSFYDTEPDCLIQGSPFGLLQLVLSKRKEHPLVTGEVEIQGDATLAHALSTALGRLDIDWEEQLARVIGDPFAYQVGRKMRAVQGWAGRTAETVAANLTEYLQEERRLLPSRYEVEEFLHEVDVLRDDVERLEAHLDRLAHRLQETGRRS